jgi:4-hydroxybenzoate polyprenyltransferase
MLAAFKIVAEVVIYRLKKLEMANMAAAASIAVALGLSIPDVAARVAFAFFLNALVYLNNDYIDVNIDLHSSDKDTTKARYLADNIRAALWAQVLMAAGLAGAAALYDPGLLVALFVGGGICWWYSAVLKRRPFVDILAMMVWGVTMPLCGVPLASVLGWCMAAQLGLFSGVFESIQVMRDAEDDAEEENVRTTGVVLGPKKTLALARAIMVSVTAYALLVMHPIAGALSAAAFAVPFHEDRIAQYWTRVKLVYGITWLFICAWVFLYGQSSGLLWSIPRSPTTP